MNRRFTLLNCLVLAAALYAALLYAAPRIVLMAPNQPTSDVLRYFKVELHDPAEQTQVREDQDENALDTRPGNIDDLLARTDELLDQEDRLYQEALQPEMLADRLATDTPERAYDLDQNPEVISRLDSRILEIAEDTARRDIEVTRRLVRPSPDRLVPADAMPTLRSVLPERETIAMRYDPAPAALQPGEPNQQEEAEAPAPPPFEAEALRPLDIEPELPPLPVEDIVERAPVKQAVEQARDESSFSFIDDLVDIELDAYLPPGDPLGYFRLRILPKQDKPIDPLPKRVTFVIDASGSIAQHKLNNTVRGVSDAIGLLRPEDQFNVVVFRDSPQLFRPEPVAATPDNRDAGKAFINGLESGGETDVYKAIQPVLQEAPPEGEPGVVFVVSDGRPTTGVRDSRVIINGLTADNRLRNSIFAFGGGRTVNRYLLDLLAYRNKGDTGLARSIDDIDERLPQFFEQLRDPLLVDLDADFGRVDEAQVFPREVPDFYRDRPVTIYGRFDPKRDKNFFVRLTGKAGPKEKELIFRENLAEAATGDINIARSWAFQKSYYIIGEISRQGERPELLAELQRLAQDYNIRTSYTE